MRQNINYTNTIAGKISMTVGRLAKGASYVAGLAALTGLIVSGLENDVATASESANYFQEFLGDLSNNRESLFMTSVIANLSGGVAYGIGKWKNWRKND